MRTVLMAVDVSAGSQSVLSVYKTMVPEPENVILVHVQQPEGRSAMVAMLNGSEPDTLRASRDPIKGAEHREVHDHPSMKIVKDYQAAVESSTSARVKTLIREGIPADEILRVARDENVDLIIIGSRKRTGLRRLASGSTTRKVEKTATVPVLVAQKAA
jgi:nucleotide-binding universal stress UspA family protein